MVLCGQVFSFSFLLISLQLTLVWSSFHAKSCSGQGISVNVSSGLCNCFPGFTGYDCSLRLCPSAKAWVDYPYAVNKAHADYTECSNMGSCDRATGKCKCRTGFSGPACDYIMCTNGTSSAGDILPCSGNGRCLSLRDASEYENFVTYLNRTTYSDWDADKIQGCRCDSGWEGVACNRRSCPKGDDPSTPGSDTIQIIDCTCQTCSGSVRLRFGGKDTSPLPYDASADLIKYRLLALPGLEQLHVTLLKGSQMCSATGSVVKVQISVPQGLLPAILAFPVLPFNGSINIRTNGLPSEFNSTFVSTRGSREFVECSHHGICDYRTGSCRCFKGFGSSDGSGNIGTRGDCGYQYLSTISHTISSNMTMNSTCPFVRNLNSTVNSTMSFCGGRGVCNHTSGLCTCDEGFGGPGCVYRTCSSPQAWFGNAMTDHVGHSVCSGVGDCDVSTGKCMNCGGGWGVFYGDYCQHLSCESGVNGTCGGNGQCLSLRELALLSYNVRKELSGVTYTDPWDADMVHGCACYRSITVDNQFMNRTLPISHDTDISILEPDIYYSPNNYYRGLQAFSATDWKGYDCMSSLCPKGDNPLVKTGSNEIQTMRCVANNGTMKFLFRGNYSDDIPFNATGEELRKHLRRTYTIHDVQVTLVANDSVSTLRDSICNYNGNTDVRIEFVSEFGDLPILAVDTSLLDGVNYSQLVNITEYQKGSKQELECSGMGLCDERTGRCACAEGFQSSNGSLQHQGERGDCSYYNPSYTILYDGNH